MPKLTKAKADQARTAAKDWGDGFEPLKPGRYLCRLHEVTTAEGPKGPYWKWTFEEVNTKTRLYENTSLSADALGRLGKVFEAFGKPEDTDTDEMIGELVCLVVGTRTQAVGERAGQLQNTVNGFKPAAEHPDFDPESVKPGSGASADDYGTDGPDSAEDPAPAPADPGTDTPLPDLVDQASQDDTVAWALVQAICEKGGIDPDEYEWADLAEALDAALREKGIDPDAYATWEALINASPVGDEEPF